MTIYEMKISQNKAKHSTRCDLFLFSHFICGVQRKKNGEYFVFAIPFRDSDCVCSFVIETSVERSKLLSLLVF